MRQRRIRGVSMTVRRSFNSEMLTRLRKIPAEDALVLLAIHVKADPTYLPLKSDHSRRWYVRTATGEFEILTTGVKWYDMRAHRGGGGTVDLAMHVLDLSFVDAVKYLIKRVG